MIAANNELQAVEILERHLDRQGFMYRKGSTRCGCGETETVEVYDRMVNKTYIVAICHACGTDWNDDVTIQTI
jgi:hypothetical protein